MAHEDGPQTIGDVLWFAPSPFNLPFPACMPPSVGNIAEQPQARRFLCFVFYRNPRNQIVLCMGPGFFDNEERGAWLAATTAQFKLGEVKQCV